MHFLVIKGQASCFTGFNMSSDGKKCFFISTYTMYWTYAEQECKIRTFYQGGVAEVRDNETRDFLYPKLTSMYFVIYYKL